MFITDSLYSELIEYFAARPWKEANPFIAKLVQAKQADKPITPVTREPKLVASKEK